MDIRIIDNKQIWTDFFNGSGSPSFLHSWEWGEMEAKQGYKIERIGIYDRDKLEAIALIIKIRSKRGSFLFVPHGPIFMKHETCNIKHLKSLISQFLSFLISLAKKEGFSFIRMAPTLEDRPESQKLFSDLGFKKAPIYMHSETMWILPLNKTEDELLAQMRKTTRYLIRKATKDGIMIEKRTDPKAVDDFYKLFEETVKRENFTPFSKKFIRDEFETFHKTGNAIFLFARKKSEIRNPKSQINSNDQNVLDFENSNLDIVSDLDISASNLYLASALVVFTNSTAFYHQGASIHSKYPAPYLLQWEAIKEAKKRGCQFYNFWGILKPGRTPKAWSGLTLFKQGFGGQELNYLPTQDFVISPKYYLTYFYEKFLNLKRGV